MKQGRQHLNYILCRKFVEWQKTNLILSIISPWNSLFPLLTWHQVRYFPITCQLSLDAFVSPLLFCSPHKCQCSLSNLLICSLLPLHSLPMGSLILTGWWPPVNVSSSFPSPETSPINSTAHQIAPQKCFSYLTSKMALLSGFLSPVIGSISKFGPQTHILGF